MAFDVASGRVEQLWRHLRGPFQWRLTPDGRALTYLNSGTVVTRALEVGAPEMPLTAGEELGVWAADGSAFYMPRRFFDSATVGTECRPIEGFEIRRIKVQGGRPGNELVRDIPMTLFGSHRPDALLAVHLPSNLIVLSGVSCPGGSTGLLWIINLSTGTVVQELAMSGATWVVDEQTGALIHRPTSAHDLYQAEQAPNALMYTAYGLSAISPDGRWLAHSDCERCKAGGPARIELLDVVTGTDMEIADVAQDTLPRSLAFSPDGRWLAWTAGLTGKDLNGGAAHLDGEDWRVRTRPSYGGNGFAFEVAAVAPGSGWVLYSDGTLWSADTGQVGPELAVPRTDKGIPVTGWNIFIGWVQ
jgi:hypothetical protein